MIYNIYTCLYINLTDRDIFPDRISLRNISTGADVEVRINNYICISSIDQLICTGRYGRLKLSL